MGVDALFLASVAKALRKHYNNRLLDQADFDFLVTRLSEIVNHYQKLELAPEEPEDEPIQGDKT